MQFRRTTIASLLVASIASNFSPTVNAFAMSGLGWGPTSPKHTASTTLRKATAVAAAEAEAEAGADDECVKTVDLLSLDYIRSTLIRQEETIIFAAIERSQYRRNHIVYTSGGFGDLGVPLGAKAALQDGEEPLSFLEYVFIGTVSFESVMSDE